MMPPKPQLDPARLKPTSARNRIVIDYPLELVPTVERPEGAPALMTVPSREEVD